MSKWRPVPQNCLYVIPDIHGANDLLQKILDRILPLRKSDGVKDQIIFLGDYIDRHIDSPKVLDTCIDLKKKYGSQVTFLLGNHELMLLRAMDALPGRKLTMQDLSSSYEMWRKNGGFETLAGYLQRAGVTESNLLDFPRNRVIDYVPAEHIKFMQEGLVKCHETDSYIFVHGGMDPTESAYKQDLESLVWDRALCKSVITAINRGYPLEWEKTIVTGHNVQNSRLPVISDKFMMLDCGSPKQLLVVELNSMEAFMAAPDKKRLVKYKLDPTEATRGFLRRVDP